MPRGPALRDHAGVRGWLVGFGVLLGCSPAADVDPCPPLPGDLPSSVHGNGANASVAPSGPAWLLAGGSPGPDAALAWWSGFVRDGDVVILRTNEDPGHEALLWDALAPVDSVETLTIRTRAHADAEGVACRLRRAEGIYVAGGWQGTYLDAWAGTPVATALEDAWERGAAIGGNSAGLAVMGELIFAAHEGSVTSDEALADPYGPKMTLERGFVELPLGAGILFDTHFAERDRMGRSVAFMARVIEDGWHPDPVVIGVDEDTALTVDSDGVAEVRGSGSVYLLEPPGPPAVCVPGVPLEYGDVAVYELSDGDTVSLPDPDPEVEPLLVSASAGELIPPDPY